MPIQSNAADKHVVSAGERWTGVTNMMVKAINPTMDEMKALGQNPSKEPVYIKDEASEPSGMRPGGMYKKNRLDLVLYHPEKRFFTKAAIWLENRPRWNRDGSKIEWINKYGNTAWATNMETPPQPYANYSLDGVRISLSGEGTLSNFIRAWANCSNDQQVVLDDPMSLANGDYKEIRDLFKQVKDNPIQVLLGVRKVVDAGKTSFFQSVYTGHFDRSYNKDMTRWIKALEGEYGEFDADWQNDLTFRLYEGGKVITGDKPTNLEVPQQGMSTSPQPNVTPYNF